MRVLSVSMFAILYLWVLRTEKMSVAVGWLFCYWLQTDDTLDLIEISIPTIDVWHFFSQHISSIEGIGKRYVFGNVEVKGLIVEALIPRKQLPRQPLSQILLAPL